MVKNHGHRAGFVYMDVLLGMAILATAVMSAMVFYRAQARDSRNTYERLAAIMICESELEKLQAIAYDSIPVGERMPLVSTLPSAQRLKAGAIFLTVSENAKDTMEATVTVEWDSPTGRRLRAESTAWRPRRSPRE